MGGLERVVPVVHQAGVRGARDHDRPAAGRQGGLPGEQVPQRLNGAVAAASQQHHQGLARDPARAADLIQRRREPAIHVANGPERLDRIEERPQLPALPLRQVGVGGIARQQPQPEQPDAAEQGRDGRHPVVDADAFELAQALPGVRIGRLDQRHAGNLVGIPVGEHPHRQAAQRVPHQHVGPGDRRPGQQGVQLTGVLHRVARPQAAVAPAQPGPVVGADPGGLGDLGLHQAQLDTCRGTARRGSRSASRPRGSRRAAGSRPRRPAGQGAGRRGGPLPWRSTGIRRRPGRGPPPPGPALPRRDQADGLAPASRSAAPRLHRPRTACSTSQSSAWSATSSQPGAAW